MGNEIKHKFHFTKDMATDHYQIYHIGTDDIMEPKDVCETLIKCFENAERIKDLENKIIWHALGEGSMRIHPHNRALLRLCNIDPYEAVVRFRKEREALHEKVCENHSPQSVS